MRNADNVVEGDNVEGRNDEVFVDIDDKSDHAAAVWVENEVFDCGDWAHVVDENK